MDILGVTKGAGRAGVPEVRVVLAFAAIYLLWGGTFLAIRTAVLDAPPFFVSGVRFLLAGTGLYAFMRLRGQPSPTLVQWRSIALLALCMFVLTYGALFWAEQYVPSGVASVVEATLPLTTMVIEVFIFRRHALQWRMGAAVMLGFLGVASMMVHGGQQVPAFPCFVILGGGVAWSLGAVLTRSMPAPRSLALAAGAQMMLGGAVLLMLSLASGELHTPPHITLRAGLALAYLVVAGSLLGFTAYVWLLTRMPATRVASHAYVNPLVALALGYFAAGEPLTLRVLVASALVIVSVVVILTGSPGRDRARHRSRDGRGRSSGSAGAPRLRRATHSREADGSVAGVGSR